MFHTRIFCSKSKKMFTTARKLVCTILASPAAYKKPVFQPRLAIAMESKGFATKATNFSTNTVGTKVLHDPEAGEFYIEIASKSARASLFYEMEENVIVIQETLVPDELSGKGYGKALAKAALKHIVDKQYQIVSNCDFFSNYVQKYHPEYLHHFED